MGGPDREEGPAYRREVTDKRGRRKVLLLPVLEVSNSYEKGGRNMTTDFEVKRGDNRPGGRRGRENFSVFVYTEWSFPGRGEDGLTISGRRGRKGLVKEKGGGLLYLLFSS